jgi:serine/threonine protein kinase
LTIAQVLRYAISISLLVSRIHAAGWAWRDCKPANIIVTKEGEMRPLDFEGACPVDQPDPFTWNTPEFAPPECEQENPGESRAPEDLYALGAITYYLITGQLPKSSGPVVTMEELRRGIPETVRDIVSKLLARDPRHRPGSEAVVESLKHALVTLGPRFEISQPEAACE